MKASRAVFFILVSILLLAGWQEAQTLAEDTDAKCSLSQARDLVGSATEALKSTRNNLKALMAGTLSDPAGAQGLFKINLVAEDEVKSRLEQLRSDTKIEFSAMFPACADHAGPLSTQFNNLLSLQNEVTGLRIQFLSLNSAQRENLLRLARTAAASEVLGDNASARQIKALAEERQARQIKKRALELAQDEEQKHLASLATSWAEVAEIQIRIARSRIELSQSYQKQIEKLQQTNEELAQLAKPLGQPKNEPKLNAYKETVKLWRTLVEQGLGEEIFINLNTLKMPGETRYGSKTEIYQEYRQTYQNATRGYEALQGEILKYRQAIIETHLNVLSNAGQLRSQYIEKLSSQIKLDENYLADLARELKIVPFRVFALAAVRLVELEGNLSTGLQRYINLTQSIFLLIILIALPFVLMRTLRKVTDLIEKSQRDLRSFRQQGRLRTRLVMFLQGIRPYLPYLLAYLFIALTEDLLAETFLEEIVILLPYFEIFVVYRVIYLLLEAGLRRVGVLGTVKEEAKVHRTLKFFGRFFFLMSCVIHATETMVGQAFFYNLVMKTMWAVSLLALALASFSWRDEIGDAIHRRFSGAWAGRVESLAKSRLGILLALPLFLGLAGHNLYRAIAGRLFELDFAKKALARLMRKQIEAAGGSVKATDIEDLPTSYVKLFDFDIPQDESYTETDTLPITRCSKHIKQWQEDKSDESTLAVFGEKGIGKSTLLTRLTANHSELKTISVSVPPKVCTTDQLLGFLEKTLKTKLQKNPDNLVKWDKKAQKTLLLLDDAHNLFLADIGGFEAFRTFVHMVNLRLDNLFVCATFNLHSWLFLDSVFGKNQYFRNEVKISPWKEEEIRNLVLKRHRQSSFSLKYDPIIAAGAAYLGDGNTHNNSEKRFFRLLWEQCDGNPRTALYTWLSCVKLRKKQISVGLPPDVEKQIFTDLQPDTLFVYAAVVKHENLNLAEAQVATNLAEGLVHYALKLGVEREFLTRSHEGRYRLNPGWHGTVIDLLKERNLLYA